METLPPDFEDVFAPTCQSFRLLDLPTELWVHILAFCVEKSHTLDPTQARQGRHQARAVAQPAITKVSRLLRSEALPLFYRLNHFELQHLHDTPCTRDWMVAIGDANRRAMGSLIFHTSFEPEEWVGLFGKCGIEVTVEEARVGKHGCVVTISKAKAKGCSCVDKALLVRFL